MLSMTHSAVLWPATYIQRSQQLQDDNAIVLIFLRYQERSTLVTNWKRRVRQHSASSQVSAERLRNRRIKSVSSVGLRKGHLYQH